MLVTAEAAPKVWTVAELTALRVVNDKLLGDLALVAYVMSCEPADCDRALFALLGGVEPHVAAERLNERPNLGAAA